MNNNNPIFDHMDQCFDQLLNTKPEKKFKFTIRYEDGSQSQPIFKAISAEKARAALSYWYPGCVEILGCKEL